MTVLSDCTTLPNSLPLLHHWCLQSVFTQSKLLIIFAVVICSFAVLTDRLVRIGAEVPGTHGDVWTTAGWWRGLAELQRVDDIIIFIYGLPCVAAAQVKSIAWLNPTRLAVIWNVEKPSSLNCLLVHLCTTTIPQILMCCKNNNCTIIQGKVVIKG